MQTFCLFYICVGKVNVFFFHTVTSSVIISSIPLLINFDFNFLQPVTNTFKSRNIHFLLNIRSLSIKMPNKNVWISLDLLLYIRSNIYIFRPITAYIQIYIYIFMIYLYIFKVVSVYLHFNYFHIYSLLYILLYSNRTL